MWPCELAFLSIMHHCCDSSPCCSPCQALQLGLVVRPHLTNARSAAEFCHVAPRADIQPLGLAAADAARQDDLALVGVRVEVGESF